MTPKTQFLKIDILDLIKIKNFVFQKRPLRTCKASSLSGRKYLQTVADKGLICRIYKEQL